MVDGGAWGQRDRHPRDLSGALRLIIVETTEGTIVIGIGVGADADEYEDWLVVAAEILSGVSFVDATP